MEKQNDQNPEKTSVPDTTRKEEGTTSAFSAASIDPEPTKQPADPKKQGGTETEPDEFGGAKRKGTDEGKETVGIP